MNTTPDHFLLTNQLLIAIDLIGVFVMGIVGGSLARRLQFDAVGYAVLGVISGLGGGIIRDLILNYGIPAAFANPLYLTVGLAGSAIAYIVSSEYCARSLGSHRHSEIYARGPLPSSRGHARRHDRCRRRRHS